MSDLDVLKAQRDQLQWDLDAYIAKVGDLATTPHALATIDTYKRKIAEYDERIASEAEREKQVPHA